MYKLAVEEKMIEFYTKTLKPPRTYTEAAARKRMAQVALALLDKDGKVNPQGGATVDGTIYQVAAVPRDRILYLKAPGTFDWQKIELKALLD